MRESDEWLTQLAGERVKGWLLEQYIGHGRIGVVYRATSTKVDGWTAAVKLFFRTPQPGWENELQKVSRLAMIPGVVPFRELDSDFIKIDKQSKPVTLTVWEYIPPGRNLRSYLTQQPACPPTFLLAVLETILAVLHACKTKGVPHHGDLHAGNVLIGELDEANISPETLEPRAPIFVADFGYGTTGAFKQPKDDYLGLAAIGKSILLKVDRTHASASDRRLLDGVQHFLAKLLEERSEADRQPPLDILRFLREIEKKSRASVAVSFDSSASHGAPLVRQGIDAGEIKVGQYQIAEMLGDNWELWKQLFVPSIPARSRLLEPDITTLVTGPRGCGKTMLFRRLSERLMLECGPITGSDEAQGFVGLYVNANDIADAFPSFSEDSQAALLVCYANLCILSDIVAVESARRRTVKGEPSPELLMYLRSWLVSKGRLLFTNEDELEYLRNIIETIKWQFPSRHRHVDFPGREELSRHDWIRRLIGIIRSACPWTLNRFVILFIDDYSTPRMSPAMQRVLNRLLFQRSSDFVFKIATEAATTFVPQDSSGKLLQDGDDFQLLDLAEESLFMDEAEREAFLTDLFARRLKLDKRVPAERKSLSSLLGSLGLKKTAFARLLRGGPRTEPQAPTSTAKVSSSGAPKVGERRGATKAKALYHGHDVLTSLWSGDTRLMIQLVQELVEEGLRDCALKSVIRPELQDRILRNRGGAWLEVQVRNQPTDQALVEKLVAERQQFSWTGGSYGTHLKAIVEAFKDAARQLLFGPPYTIPDKRTGKVREVPRMAFRIEVTDKFRVEGLEAELYKDLIRYGLFLRDNRGKSVQGAMVPRLYLRRLLLPYCGLALSKRDNVAMNCDSFKRLLSEPDHFSENWRVGTAGSSAGQMTFGDIEKLRGADPAYDDLGDEEDD